jgi:hypothetical protein
LAEFNRLIDEVRNLQDYILPADPRVKIHYVGLFTMVDGKVLNVMTNNRSSKCCPICHAGPLLMSDPGAYCEEKEPEFLMFGCAPLHFLLRSMEFIFKIGFNKDFKCWEARLDEHKVAQIIRRDVNHDIIKDETGCRIFEVRKDGGTLFDASRRYSDATGRYSNTTRRCSCLKL